MRWGMEGLVVGSSMVTSPGEDEMVFNLTEI